MTMNENRSPLNGLIRFCLEQKLVVLLVLAFSVGWGALVAPFDWDLGGLPRDPVPVDAIPDIGENQQIIFTKWMGRSPQDVEDQITYPMTVSLLGIPGVKTIRSFSMFGFSSIYVIFEEDIEFYWSRSRILEKLNSLPAGTLPPGVQPALGPDATALGQVFWYTLEGRDPQGNPTGGWDLHELRSAQDWIVRYALMSAGGVSEVASVGGFVQEYQIDVDPDAMRAYGVRLGDVFNAVRAGNIDVGARTIELNKAEYVIRGLGFIENVGDIEMTVIKAADGAPIYVKDVAHVALGPALRRGALDKAGAEAVGGVVVVRYGDNPLAAIKNVKAKIDEIAPGLPKKTLADGTVSQIAIVPFYDRSGLIYETLGTLNDALVQEVLVTIIVVVLMVLHLRSSILISMMLPVSVLMAFIGMKMFGVDANIVALSGIAIAVGTIVDMGIVICENILKHMDKADPGENRLEVVYRASTEVGGAVLTAVATTVISFLPVFTMEAAEGKLFKPLAYTKTFALIGSIILALTVLPAMAHVLFSIKIHKAWPRRIVSGLITLAGFYITLAVSPWIGLVVAVFGVFHIVREWLPGDLAKWINRSGNLIVVGVVLVVLSREWEPIGPEKGLIGNLLLVALVIGALLLALLGFQAVYGPLLRWCLRNKLATLIVGLVLPVTAGGAIWLGFDRVFAWMPDSIRQTQIVTKVAHAVPGLGKEFMPKLDEGSFLYMPTTSPHASIGEAMDVLRKLDMAIASVPEVDQVVGKLGRVESSLDPAPISMIETVINYKSEYIVDEDGRRINFAFRDGQFERDKFGELVPDQSGRPFRQWREHIDDPSDIWNELVAAAQLPGTTSAPPLQPIETRIVMLQSGIRAKMAVKIAGPDLETIEATGIAIERLLKQVPQVNGDVVNADRIVGKPYLEIDIDREKTARHGVSIRAVQDVIEVAIGGKQLSMTVEGRERYPIRVRYMRELRDQIETLGKILVPTPGGAQIPLIELAEIRYTRGPQVIKSEDTFKVGYVMFDGSPGYAEVDVVEAARDFLDSKIDSGELDIPSGVSFTFVGSYENQVRAAKRLALVLPLALFLIFLILYFQFKPDRGATLGDTNVSILTTLMVFSGVFIAWSGGFIMIWLYNQDWFLDVDVLGTNLRELFQIRTINLSVAIWVGFLALFGIATDNGVILATYLKQTFKANKPETIQSIRDATVEAGLRRVRPCLMTTATTILALLPVLTSSGRGSDIMVPMAIPTFGGMTVVLLTLFVVPVLYSGMQEWRLRLTPISEKAEQGV